MDKLFAILIFEGEGDNQQLLMDRGKIATFKSLKKKWDNGQSLEALTNLNSTPGPVPIPEEESTN